MLRPAADPHAPAATDPPRREDAAPEWLEFRFDPSPRPVHPELASQIRHVVDDLTSSVAAGATTVAAQYLGCLEELLG